MRGIANIHCEGVVPAVAATFAYPVVLSHTETLRIEISRIPPGRRGHGSIPVRAFNVYDVDTRNLKTMLERRPHRTPPSIRLETFPI